MKINTHIGRDFHDLTAAAASDTKFTYTFENFFHPLIGELIAKLNKDSLRAQGAPRK